MQNLSDTKFTNVISTCFAMHVDSKSTNNINQVTYKMNDTILENKSELEDLGEDFWYVLYQRSINLIIKKYKRC